MDSVSIAGTGMTYGARAFVGGSQVVGTSAGSKHTVEFGFYA